MSNQEKILEVTKQIFEDPTRLVGPAEIAKKGFGSKATQFRRRRDDPLYPRPIVNTSHNTKWLPVDIVAYHIMRSQDVKAA